MPKLKFFIIAIPVISLLHLGEHLLLRDSRNFSPPLKETMTVNPPGNIIVKPVVESNTMEGMQRKAVEKFTWKMLGNIKYREKRTRDYPEGVMYPVINPVFKAKKGMPITISGYIIPIDEKHYAISKNVMSACFFCGMAGPETIMGIKFKGKTPRLKTDQYLTLSGTFNFNETNPDDWIYHIENAEILTGL